MLGIISSRFVRFNPASSVLCSNRVSQMTKTYNDIEAVTRLLEEKEKDLELTACIGKELLAHNQKLETSVAALEAELKQANEKLAQLSHELAKKTELIQILANDVDESGSESGTPTGLRCINLDFMQRRVTSLEDENRQLRSEASQLAHDTEDCEMAEQRLVQDIASKLSSANMEVDGLADELHCQKEENRQQHEELAILASKLLHAESQIHKLTADNEGLSSNLHITRENQGHLAGELADLKDQYAEVLSLLQDTQEQLRQQRRKGMPQARVGLFSSIGPAPNPDSIASELESSLYSELSLDSGIGADHRDRGGGVRVGVPGVPGTADLKAALRRLATAEVLARRATLSSDYSDGPQSPPYSSSGLSGFSGHSTGSWKLPEKLQIVKPLERSLTLAASPTLGGLLDERPGVYIRGGCLELYSLSDLEEDEESVKTSNSTSNKAPPIGTQDAEHGLGVPGRPGSGLLDRPPPAPTMVRPDLGTVLGSVPAKRSRDTVEASPGPGTLGTISSLLFGRKGGLL